MKDSWIDKDELDGLVSGFSNGQRAGNNQQNSRAEDLFDDIPSIHMPRSGPHYNPPTVQAVPQQQVQHSPPVQAAPQQLQVQSPLQVLVQQAGGPVGEIDPPKKASSPFAIDEDDELDEIESHIEHLASETAKALKTLQEVRAKADQNGLIPNPAEVKEPEIKIVESTIETSEDEDLAEVDAEEESEEEFEDEIEEVEPFDRIPLDVEIDSYLSLKGRLKALGEILKEYVGMEEMMVVDRDGFSLYSTKASLTVDKKVGEFVKSIRKVYASESDARQHTASQLAVEDGKWLCMVTTDDQIDGHFLMKALLPTPLDRPEIYVLVELLNEVLRPESK